MVTLFFMHVLLSSGVLCGMHFSNATAVMRSRIAQEKVIIQNIFADPDRAELFLGSLQQENPDINARRIDRSPLIEHMKNNCLDLLHDASHNCVRKKFALEGSAHIKCLFDICRELDVLNEKRGARLLEALKILQMDLEQGETFVHAQKNLHENFPLNALYVAMKSGTEKQLTEKAFKYIELCKSVAAEKVKTLTSPDLEHGDPASTERYAYNKILDNMASIETFLQKRSELRSKERQLATPSLPIRNFNSITSPRLHYSNEVTLSKNQ